MSIQQRILASRETSKDPKDFEEPVQGLPEVGKMDEFPLDDQEELDLYNKQGQGESVLLSEDDDPEEEEELEAPDDWVSELVEDLDSAELVEADGVASGGAVWPRVVRTARSHTGRLSVDMDKCTLTFRDDVPALGFISSLSRAGQAVKPVNNNQQMKYGQDKVMVGRTPDGYDIWFYVDRRGNLDQVVVVPSGMNPR